MHANTFDKITFMFFEVLFLMLIIFFLEVDQMISITIYPDNPSHLSNIHIPVDIYPLTTSNCLGITYNPHTPHPNPLKKKRKKKNVQLGKKRFLLFSPCK